MLNGARILPTKLSKAGPLADKLNLSAILNLDEIGTAKALDYVPFKPRMKLSGFPTRKLQSRPGLLVSSRPFPFFLLLGI
jgi:hypothetical protein